MIIVQYFLQLFATKQVKSELSSPIILMFDPELNHNKLEIKVSWKLGKRAILYCDTIFLTTLFLNLGLEYT